MNKLARSLFIVVGSFIVCLFVGAISGQLGLSFVVWLLVATIGVYQIVKEKKGA